jgi:uncharacterized protein YdeI (YjbR/CyaY-like superfamily)
MADEEPERHPSDGWLVLPFASAQELETWLDQNHAQEPGVWVKLGKKGRKVTSVSFDDAHESATCFGWVDSKTEGYDDDYYLLRYQPRRLRSNWSAGNKKLAERLIAEGRMRPSGVAQVEAAKAAGRWDVDEDADGDGESSADSEQEPATVETGNS